MALESRFAGLTVVADQISASKVYLLKFDTSRAPRPRHLKYEQA